MAARGQRIEWLDIAKGGSIICVALWHANLFMVASGFHPAVVGEINDMLIPIRMPLFFAISGALATRALARDWPVFLKGTIWSFVYLFALWGLVRWMYFREVEINVLAPEEGGSWRELLDMWLTPQSGLWFIWALAIFFLIAKLGRRLRVPLLIVSAGLAVLAWGEIIDPANYVHKNVLKYLPFFLGGTFFGPFMIETLSRRPILIGSVGALVFAGLKVLVLDRLGRGIDYGMAYAALAVSGLATGCAVSVLLGRLAVPRAVLSYVGRNTLPIYVTHVIVVSAAVGPSTVLGMRGGFLNYVGAPLLVLLAVALPLLAKALVERSSAWWLYKAPPLPNWA